MTWVVFAAQILNGVQYGVLLFLLAAGLTLVLGIMNFVNLAHGSFYMLGAYLSAWAYSATSSFVLAGVVAVFGTLIQRTCCGANYANSFLRKGSLISGASDGRSNPLL